MKERIKTGVWLFLLGAIICLIDSYFLNFVIIGLILYFSFSESMSLWGLDRQNALCFVCLAFYTLAAFTNPIFVSFLSVLVVASIVAYYKGSNLKVVLPFIYPSIPIVLIWQLYSEFGIFYVIWLILSIVASDSCAYFVGKSIGKKAFSQSSPNKTVEGVLGGILGGTFIGGIVGSFLVESTIFALLSSLFICVFGVFGDLFESYLKRNAGVKDSGNLFPGHGGMLDRIDGYLFGVIALLWTLSW